MVGNTSPYCQLTTMSTASDKINKLGRIYESTEATLELINSTPTLAVKLMSHTSIQNGPDLLIETSGDTLNLNSANEKLCTQGSLGVTRLK